MAELRTANDHHWANVIIAGSRDEQALKVVRSINWLTARGEANMGSVIVACAQILAQCITSAPLDVAAEVRTGIMGMIDDFAMRVATSESDQQQSGEST